MRPDISIYCRIGVGRVLLYAVPGVVGSVYASKQLFTKLDFQSDKGLESEAAIDR
jgi:hypothetical protein